MQYQSNNQAGFTLLELVVVIVSLIIVGAIILFIGS